MTGAASPLTEMPEPLAAACETVTLELPVLAMEHHYLLTQEMPEVALLRSQL